MSNGDQYGGITPACAGNTNGKRYWKHPAGDHPRLRGEYRPPNIPVLVFPGSPPLARGIRKATGADESHRGITPACAGNTYKPYIIKAPGRDHPRLRGEYDVQRFVWISELGSPPLARGILLNRNPVIIQIRITPACAGNTCYQTVTVTARRDHPRLRGEYEDTGVMVSNYQGSPPLARGILY